VREVLAVRASGGDRAPAEPALSGPRPGTGSTPAEAPGAGIDAGASALAARETSAPAAAGSIEAEPAPPEAAPAAEPPVLPALTSEELAPAFGTEAILPTLSADEPEPSPAPRGSSRSKRGKRSDARALRAGGPLPRSIDETDPYLE
jgi:hypothetical protein